MRKQINASNAPVIDSMRQAINAHNIQRVNNRVNGPTNQIQTQEEVEQRDEDMQRGLHRIVGKDGVMMISLPRDRRRLDYSRAKLSEVGIHAMIFWGTDGRDQKTPQGTLDKAIDFSMSAGWIKSGTNESRWAAALADSHRRALVQAKRRNTSWTAILEDDVVPVFAEGMTNAKWIQAFDSAWEKLPPGVKLVRMGYCSGQKGFKRESYANAGEFMITTWTEVRGQYEPGNCTTGYIVHKDVIPELLSVFPCKAPLDVCWQEFFMSSSSRRGNKTTNGHRIIANIEPNFSVPRLRHPFLVQHGILRQDWEMLPYHYLNATYFSSLAVKGQIQAMPHSHL